MFKLSYSLCQLIIDVLVPPVFYLEKIRKQGQNQFLLSSIIYFFSQISNDLTKAVWLNIVFQKNL